MFPNMNSPEPTHQKPLTSSSSSSPPASSPSIQESPFYSFISNLSPIRSGKAARYTQRFFQSNIPSPLPVFATPRRDLERQSSFIQSGKEGEAANSNVYVQSNNQLQPEMVSYFQKEVQSSSPSGCIDEYLADHVEMEGGPSSLPSILQGNSVHKFSKSGFSCHRHAKSNANDSITGNTRAKMMVSGQMSEEPPSSSLCFVENSTHVRSNERFNDSMELTSRKVSDLESDTLLGAFSGGEHRKRVFFQGYDQQERGIRRHLQFGIAMACTNTRNESGDAASLGSPADCMNYEANVPCRSELRGNSSGQQTDSSPRAVNSLSPFNPSESIRTAQNSGNNAPQACIPSGIGLQLNSAVKSVFRGTESTASKELAGNIHVPVGGDRKESQAVMTAGSAASKFNTMQPPCNSLQMTLFEQHAPPIEGRFTTSNGKMEESNQTSPQKNRKKGKYSTESDGCKRCNCKRSKCLKLYCECFAAGIYCLNTCSCENCFNKPEYEDTVMDARQAIEARNPLAFAPKVVNHITNSPANTVEERNWTTPASARHKRGCNCKKSKCLKKYCECYQSGVGCSDGCRCESCNNSYGKKAEIIRRRNERWENPSHERLASLETQSNSMKTGSDIQSSPTWEDVIDVSHLTPSSNPRMGPMTSSTPLNKRGYSRVSQPQSCHEPAVHSSSGYLQWNHSPTGLTPMFGSEGLHDLSSDILYNILHGDDIPKVLKNTSTPTKGVQITSPNKKRVSPPQIQSAGLRSTSSKGMRSGRKFLQDISSFPSLTPYSNLKGTSYPIDGDGEGSRPNC